MQSRDRRLLRATLSTLFAAALLWPWQPALAQFKRDGKMLTNMCDGLGGGFTVALSGDGTTAFVGAAGVTPPFYSAYVYNVTSVGWSTGCGLFVNNGFQAEGFLAASADGNTVVLGATTIFFGNDNYSLGWVFTRSGGTWSQVELNGHGVVGGPFGTIVAVSADGNTAIVGVSSDSNLNGAAWVFTNSSGVWSQQGPKLVANDAIGQAAGQGGSVALSGDGNTAIVGGFNDNNGVGAAWVFTRSNGVWTQQAKLVGSGAVGNAGQGGSVALSADGNTAIFGGSGDGEAPPLPAS
jgi:hypothetical protein